MQTFHNGDDNDDDDDDDDYDDNDDNDEGARAERRGGKTEIATSQSSHRRSTPGSFSLTMMISMIIEIMIILMIIKIIIITMREALPYQKCSFFNIVQKAFDPLPPFV